MFSRFAIVALLLMGCALFACERRRITLVAPDHYKGKVRVGCAASGSATETVKLTLDRLQTLPQCPKDAVAVDVIQGGVMLKSAKVEWSRTGDGVVTGLSVTIP